MSKLVTVGFKVSLENSVFYSKVELIDSYQQDVATIGIELMKAKAKGSEFVSVRFIP